MLVDEAIFPCRYRRVRQHVVAGAEGLAFEIKIRYPSLMKEPHERKTSRKGARATELMCRIHRASGSKASMIDAE